MGIKTYIKRGAEYVIKGIPVNYVNSNITYSTPNLSLQGKSVVITGGAKGLGYAMAKRFCEEGAKVLITGRNRIKLEESASQIGCSFLQLDVQKVDLFDAFLDKAWEILGQVDCLVNNAGVSHHEGNIRNVSYDDFEVQINTNLRAGYFLTQKFIERFEQNQLKGGNVLFVSSERSMMADDLPYGITKSAINTLVRGLARELIKSDIRVNAIAPGVTASDMTGFKQDGNLALSTQMTGRVYYPEEVAEIACFLLSDASNLLNGQILVCNEGKSINYRR